MFNFCCISKSFIDSGVDHTAILFTGIPPAVLRIPLTYNSPLLTVKQFAATDTPPATLLQLTPFHFAILSAVTPTAVVKNRLHTIHYYKPPMHLIQNHQYLLKRYSMRSHSIVQFLVIKYHRQ